jgi:hypothetical protein
VERSRRTGDAWVVEVAAHRVRSSNGSSGQEYTRRVSLVSSAATAARGSARQPPLRNAMMPVGICRW